jgi:hypothetical protein
MKVCSEMTRVLNTALEKDPEKRYQNAQEFLEKLQEAVKRDGVKHRAMKHREEVAQFHGLMEEAKAIRDSEHKRTSDEMERLAAETIAAAEADASGIAPDPQALAQAVEGALEELEGECPYCGAAVTTALALVLTDLCTRQLSTVSDFHRVPKSRWATTWAGCPRCRRPSAFFLFLLFSTVVMQSSLMMTS